MRGVAALPLFLAACVTSQVQVTSIGPLRVVPDATLMIFAPISLPDGSEIEPNPIPGGFVVRALNGSPVPFEARDAALEALEAHCRDQDRPGVPLFFGWRDSGGDQAWSAAGCDPVLEDLRT